MSLEVRVQLFAKAKELAGGRDCIVCSLASGDETIGCQDFLDRYVFQVAVFASRDPSCTGRERLLLRLCPACEIRYKATAFAWADAHF